MKMINLAVIDSKHRELFLMGKALKKSRWDCSWKWKMPVLK